jgi:hypothetical protein
MDCDICISFERSLRDRESDLAGKVKGCDAAGSQNEMVASLEALKIAVEEFLTERSLFDHHRRRAHGENLQPDADSSKIR